MNRLRKICIWVIVGVFALIGLPGDLRAESGMDYQDSPFGIMAAFEMSTLTHINAQDKIAWAGNHFRNLGAKWSRGGVRAIWCIIEPVLGGGYNWSNADEVLKGVYDNGGDDFNMIVIFSPTRVRGESPDIAQANEDYFKDFIKAFVERYDGDGVDDYDSNIKVKYWQAENEPFPRHWERNGGTVDGYVRFVELLHDSVLEADPNAKIILGTCQWQTTEELAKFSEVVSKMKNKNLFDYADTHFWSLGNKYKMPVTEARNILNSNGYSYVKLMSLESGTWVDYSRYPETTEKDQARYLIKSYVYNLANGFSMINWNNLVEWSNFGGNPGSIYNYIGLIADGQNGDVSGTGVPRLSYYTYKLMVEKLEGFDCSSIGTIGNLPEYIYAYKFTKKDTGKPVWVAWWDCFDDVCYGNNTFELSTTSDWITVTEAVADAESSAELKNKVKFKSDFIKTSGGYAVITLGTSPVFIEEGKVGAPQYTVQ